MAASLLRSGELLQRGADALHHLADDEEKWAEAAETDVPAEETGESP